MAMRRHPPLAQRPGNHLSAVQRSQPGQDRRGRDLTHRDAPEHRCSRIDPRRRYLQEQLIVRSGLSAAPFRLLRQMGLHDEELVTIGIAEPEHWRLRFRFFDGADTSLGG
jgi:hypothetical protein